MDVQASELLSDERFQQIVQRMEKDKGLHGYSTMYFVLHLLDLADGLFVSRDQVSEAAHKYDIRNAELELLRQSGASGYLQPAWAGSMAVYRMVGRGRELYKSAYQPKPAPTPTDGPAVFFLEAGKPRTAHLQLGRPV